MDTLLEVVSVATDKAVGQLYRTCRRIELVNGEVNGRPVSPWVYAAVLERIRYNAGLTAATAKPGVRSQVMTLCGDEHRNFDVEVGCDGGLVAMLRE